MRLLYFSNKYKNNTVFGIGSLLNICHSFMILGGIGFWLVGYGLAFGQGSNGIVGTSYFAAVGLPFELYPHLFFQVC